MPLEISRLRRWVATSAVLLALFVAGVYFYARHRVQNALKDVPGKINLEVQQSANGFSISRSEQGRTVFKVQANKAVQFREGGRVELHDVTITLFGRDSSRFDQIYGADFVYDPRSGEVTSKGEVQIDLEANPQGLDKPDQAPPKELKNPLHLRTSGLVFNQKTGNAFTHDKVEFSLPQAQGSSVGVSYDAERASLVLESQVQVDFSGQTALHLTARRGNITKQPRTVVVDAAVLTGSEWKSQADKATLFLNQDNSVDHLTAAGNVTTSTNTQQRSHAVADQMLARFTADKKSLSTVIFEGNVKAEVEGAQPLEAAAQQVRINFSGRNLVNTIHSAGNVKLLQHQRAAGGAAQDVEVAAAAIDYLVRDGRRLKEASTEGPGQITIRSLQNTAGQTDITADKLVAHFDSRGQIASLHGAPHARIVSSLPEAKDRISTSDNIDAAFRPGKGIDSLVQRGNFEYSDGEQHAWSGVATYLPDQEQLTLTQAPKVTSGGLVTTASVIRLNRNIGEGTAEGDVKSTYSDLKPDPQGALFASGSPIHVTAQRMKASRSPTVAVYSGNARLWQDANVVQAPAIQFDRDHRSVTAEGSGKQPVSTVLVQVDKNGKAAPVTVSSNRLTYTDSERRAHFEGSVIAKGAGVVTSASNMDVFLQPAGDGQKAASSSAGKIDHIVATGGVVVAQPDRRANGDRLVYTAGDDKFVMTGGPPSIFDAEHGKITGVSLTFFRGDDRVVIEGSEALPTVTQTRVAR